MLTNETVAKRTYVESSRPLKKNIANSGPLKANTKAILIEKATRHLCKDQETYLIAKGNIANVDSGPGMAGA